jgi:CRP/FNR family cyclic AMP-dependent transcriptional regulator
VNWPILESLVPEDRQKLLALAGSRTFRSREVIFHAGDPGETLFLIRAGRAAVRIVTEDGDTMTLVVLGPGDMFGELALLGEAKPRAATVVALEATQTWTLSRAQLARLRAEHPQIDQLLIDLLAAQVGQLTSQLIEALYVPVRKRVVRALLRLYETSEREQESKGPKSPVVLLVTQDDIAGLAGATRPTVNQVLQALQSAGALALRRGRIEIVNEKVLARRR